MHDIVLIAHNLRSCHNVGSLLRTAEGLGVQEVFLTGYTPYPMPVSSPFQGADTRLPHIAAKIQRRIRKTALGAEVSQPWQHLTDIDQPLMALRGQGYVLAAVEQAAGSQPLNHFKPPAKLALLVGRETEGVEPEVLDKMDIVLEIPMFGTKESFNVVQAAAMALYQCRFQA